MVFGNLLIKKGPSTHVTDIWTQFKHALRNGKTTKQTDNDSYTTGEILFVAHKYDGNYTISFILQRPIRMKPTKIDKKGVKTQ